MSPNDVLAALSSLTPDRLREARARIDLLLKGTPSLGPASGRRSEQAALAYQVLSEAIRDATGAPGAPFSVFAGGRDGPAFARAVVELLRYLDWAFGCRTDDDREVALRLSLGLLLEWMGERDIPRTPASAARLLDHVHSLLDRAFPGYLGTPLASAALLSRST